MAIALATTTITVTRVEAPADDTDGDPTDGYAADLPDPVTVVSNVRATIGAPSANTSLSGGDRVVYTATFVCDPTDIQPGDQITDSNGDLWQVDWARRAQSVGIDHVIGEARMLVGED